MNNDISNVLEQSIKNKDRENIKKSRFILNKLAKVVRMIDYNKPNLIFTDIIKQIGDDFSLIANKWFVQLFNAFGYESPPNKKK
jgi:hypothetical protein